MEYQVLADLLMRVKQVVLAVGLLKVALLVVATLPLFLLHKVIMEAHLQSQLANQVLVAVELVVLVVTYQVLAELAELAAEEPLHK